MPELPNGTIAVGRGLYLRILSVVPPFLGICFNIAGILWIMFGTGTESNLYEKLCCTGAGRVLVVVIDMRNPLIWDCGALLANDERGHRIRSTRNAWGRAIVYADWACEGLETRHNCNG